MKDVEVELRRVLRERAAVLTSAPPLDRSLLGPRQTTRRGKGRRRAVIVGVAAILLLAAGVALSQVLIDPQPPTVTPVTEQLVVASGETVEGPWQLTAYRAELEGQWWTGGGFEYEVRTAWCLDLDGPMAEEAGDPPTQRANMCTEGQDEAIEPIGAVSRIPEFDEDKSLVYGMIASDVARLDVEREGGQQVEASIVRAPAEWNLQVDYFFAFISGRGKVTLVARDSKGQVIEERRV